MSCISRVLKELASELGPLIAHLFQQSVDPSEIPNEWPLANIRPLHKKEIGLWLVIADLPIPIFTSGISPNRKRQTGSRFLDRTNKQPGSESHTHVKLLFYSIFAVYRKKLIKLLSGLIIYAYVNMPVKHCCYGSCNSDSRYYGKREDMDGVTFIPFPKQKTQLVKCERWIKLCGRKYFSVENIKKETYICSKHFVGGRGPTPEHPDPLPALATSFERNILLSKRKRKSPRKRYATPKLSKRKKLAFDLDEDTDNSNCASTGTDSDLPKYSVHTDHCYHSQNTQCTTNCEQPESSSETSPRTISEIGDDEHHNLSDVLETTLGHEEHTVSTCFSQTTQTHSSMTRADIGVQTDLKFDDLAKYEDSELQDKKKLQRNLLMSYILKDDESCKFYTGLNLAVFTMLFTWLQNKADKLSYWRGQDTTEAKANKKPKPGPSRKLTVKEEFVLVLVRLRRGFDVEVLGDLFGIHASNISRIFITWINFLYLELKFLIAWPSKEQVKSTLPKQFKYFPKTRAIIDCTEFFIQKPSLPSSQRVTWSQYKHHNTFKSLVGISPTGAFTFISKLFTGSISDRRIVEESGFVNKLEYGDDIMADRGFLIRDLLARNYATLNIPPFSMGKQMTGKAVTKTRRIASARIHVERAIGRLKNFKILQGIIPLKLHAVLDQIVIVCATLCNLDYKLVK